MLHCNALLLQCGHSSICSWVSGSIAPGGGLADPAAMRSLQKFAHPLLVFLSDALGICLAWFLAYLIRFNFAIPAEFQDAMLFGLARPEARLTLPSERATVPSMGSLRPRPNSRRARGKSASA
mgnify:CR=1 FL=1